MFNSRKPTVAPAPVTSTPVASTPVPSPQAALPRAPARAVDTSVPVRLSTTARESAAPSRVGSAQATTADDEFAASASVPVRPSTAAAESTAPPRARAAQAPATDEVPATPVRESVAPASASAAPSRASAPALPFLLRIRSAPEITIRYVVSPEDILAAIKEGKTKFIALLLNNEGPSTGVMNQDMLWESLTKLGARRLETHLIYKIREAQKNILSSYNQSHPPTEPISISHLNSLLAPVTMDSEPIYRNSAREVYEKYINQLTAPLQDGDEVQCNDTIYSLDNPALRKAIARDVASFLAHCRSIFTLKFTAFSAFNIEAQIKELNANAAAAEKTYRELTQSYDQTLLSIETYEAAQKQRRDEINLFVENFSNLAPSTFKKELEDRGMSTDDTDFKQRLTQIFLASSLRPLQESLFHAVESNSPEMVDLLLMECVKTFSNPLEPHGDSSRGKDQRGNTILHNIVIRTKSADAPAHLTMELRKLRAVLETIKIIKHTEVAGVYRDEAMCSIVVNRYLVNAFLLENDDKETVIDLIFQADRCRLFTTVREYITTPLIEEAVRARASQFEDKVVKHLLSYGTKLSALEDKPETRAILDDKRVIFDDRSTAYRDELYPRLIQRRKALDSLWLALWVSPSFLRDQIRVCGIMNDGFSEPGALFFSGSNGLIDPLVSISDDYMKRKVGGQERVSAHHASAAGTSLSRSTASASSEGYPSLEPHLTPSIASGRRIERPVISSIGMRTENMKLSIQLDAMLLRPIKDYTPNATRYPERFVPLEPLRLAVSKKKLTGFHLDIYNLILNSYKGSTSNYLYFFFARPTYASASNWALLRKHMSRMTEALILIAEHSLDESYNAQLVIIKHCLMEGLKAMAHDLRWVSSAAFLYTDLSPSKKTLLEISGNDVFIISPEVAADRTIAQLSADLIEAKATAAADTAAAKAIAAADTAAVKAIAAADTAEAKAISAAEIAEVKASSAATEARLAKLEALIARSATGATMLPSSAALSAHGVFPSAVTHERTAPAASSSSYPS